MALFYCSPIDRIWYNESQLACESVGCVRVAFFARPFCGEVRRLLVAELEGTNVGPYEIKVLLGVGGMGQVYRARDPRLEREVAIKVLTASLAHEPGYLERFRREARAVAKLNHPHIVPVYDFGEQGDLTYLVMPLITGGTLREYLASRHILPLSEAVSIIEQVAGALQYAHERGLVHRDVKTANILISDEGRALLTDFGIVRLVQKEDAAATLTSMGAFVGSPEYAAPEMVVGEAIDHRVDVYALGVVLFQMLTGRLPFAGPTPVSLMMMQVQQPPPMPRSLNPDIPAAVEAVILKALAKAPAERYQTAAEFQAALRVASTAPPADMRYTSEPAAGAIADLPTISTYGMPPTPGSGPAPMPGSSPAIFPSAGLGSAPPPVWIGPGSSPSGWAAPDSSPMMPPGSGPSGWAAPSGSSTAPPLPPTYATGLSILPNQAPLSPPLATPLRQRRMLLVLGLALMVVVVLVGGSLGVLRVLSTRSGTPVPGATSTSVVSKATATFTTKPAAPAGTITEFNILPSGTAPWGIITGPGAALWFTEYSSDQIGRFTSAGAFNEFPVPTAGSLPLDITLGPDGNLWFTEYAGNQIGRLTPQGAFKEFPIPGAASKPWGITTGPDGNLWFTERIGKIGRITPQGIFNEFPLPTANGDPLEITLGPDGNLWFTEYGGNQIGRLTPQGAFKEFPIPGAASKPWGITTGPDGNLWFTEQAANHIGRITPTGTLTEFPVPTTNGQPVGITMGPDSDLWFTEFGDRIGRITPTGTLTEFPIPAAGSYPVGIAVGPDRNLWFTEYAGNQIGRITSGK